ncbi:unnamed protein product [Caenorhabditis brenneri]
MFLIVIEITFLILFTVPVFSLCSARGSNSYDREKSEKEETKEPSVKSKRARPLEPDELIPLAEGSEKSPDVGEMITERSKKSNRLRKSQKMKGFVLEKDRSVRRLENRSKYEAKTSARYKRSMGAEGNPSGKSAKSPKTSKKSKKLKRESKKSDRQKKSKEEKKMKSEPKLKKKKSVISEKQHVEEQDQKEGVNRKEDDEEVKPKKKNRNPLKKLFRMKRKKARNDVHVVERNGTWA